MRHYFTIEKLIGMGYNVSRENMAERFFPILRGGDVLPLSHTSISKNQIITIQINSDNDIGTSNLPHGNIQNDNQFNTLVIKKK